MPARRRAFGQTAWMAIGLLAGTILMAVVLKVRGKPGGQRPKRGRADPWRRRPDAKGDLRGARSRASGFDPSHAPLPAPRDPHPRVTALPGRTTSRTDASTPASAPAARGVSPAARALEALKTAFARLVAWARQLDNALLLLSLGVYLAVRLIRLTDYPIWFFTDEANQTVLAADFVRNGFRDFLGHYFPTYFQNVYAYNLSISVYAQVIPFILFGKSLVVTRATSVLLTVLGALAIGLTLRRVFGSRYGWSGVLLLSCSPAWFLHSRTAFETALMASFYACFLYFYLLYRTHDPRHLYPALVFAAAVFYTYGPGEIIILGTGLLLLAVDANYHWAQRKTIARGLLVGAVLALPYVRFRILMPVKHEEALRLISSVWVTAAPLGQKLATSARYYVQALDPRYWFLTNHQDLARHVMDGYGNLMTWSLPLVLAGLALAVRRFRRPEYRSVLMCVLGVPLGAAVAGGGITRLLAMIVPATILGAVGVDLIAGWFSRRLRPWVVALCLFVILSLPSFYLLRDALVNGPLWDRNYGMDIPYGAPQVFGAIGQWLKDEPDATFYVSPTWANGVDTLQRLFLPDHAPVSIANADRFTGQRQPLTDKTILVLTAPEYEAARQNPKLADVRVAKMIPYPDGTPGFYFIRMRYSDQADAIFEQERLERLKPVTETLEVDGSVLTIEHSLFDSGGVQQLFDSDPYTLARGYEANPMLLKISFDSPRRLSGVDITTGSMDSAITVRLVPAGGGEPVVYTGTYRNLPMDPTIRIDFPGAPPEVARIELEIENLLEPGPAKIHLREIRFR